ncbi:MFS transporter, PPP family, 3-phenylpropionic acid transporter [Candidatus Methylobacter favarea]|uniref:MFS transporter, PPP family, 3-phenylpropionic acid transporter n=1 Tax=Candidatus Methylobacter favarea TaxID=2707345 RepID=A0A8S0XTI6_9GAMM|nr:MFS transporter [Candidatus Methylobacter favarea]CAA9891616.1 MFS transporter, PPP family, 3-phenylpropionic acid transporter [Candidatus Methylobacter favarea]
MTVPYWRLSGFYFFFFAALGAHLPYWSLYLKDSGFNPVEIGKLSALLVGTKIIAPNLWGWIADHTCKSLRIIRIASFFAALIFAGFLFIHSYFWYAWITVGFSFFWNAVLPQFEAATLFHLKSESHRYSQIRLWGSFGFIVAVLTIGWLLDSQPITILPLVITALLILTWCVTLITPQAHAATDSSAPASLLQILKKPEVLAFLAVYMLLQAAHAPYYVFYSIYLNHHHYNGTLTGILWALGVFAEIFLFIYMRRLLTRFSLRKILLFSILLSIIRWLLIAWYADYPGLLIIAQLLHAATFGSAHVAAIHLVHIYFGHQHQGKGQALYSSAGMGLGGMLGSLFGGYYWEALSPELVYTMAAATCGIAFIIAYTWVGREITQNKAALS